MWGVEGDDYFNYISPIYLQSDDLWLSDRHCSFQIVYKTLTKCQKAFATDSFFAIYVLSLC